MKSLSRISKRGQTLELVSGTTLGFLTLIVLMFSVLYAVSVLNPSSFFTAASANANSTNALTQNLTQGVGSFGSYIPTVFLVLGVVLVLSIIFVLIVYVRRMGGGSSSGAL